jgi:hypothetical protein
VSVAQPAPACRTLSGVTDPLPYLDLHDREAVDLAEAAVRLGITVDAARKRVARGHIPGIKREGKWYALLPIDRSISSQDRPAGQYETGHDRSDRQQSADPTGPGPAADRPDELVAQLRGEIAFLRGEIATLHEANRRKDTIIAALVQRAELPPVNDRSDRSEQSRNNAPPPRQEAPQAPSPRFHDVLVTLRRWLRGAPLRR